MTLGDNYATLLQLKDYLGITDIVDDAKLTDALVSTSRGIEKVCGRVFNDAGTASARLYPPQTASKVTTDDFHTLAGLEVATDLDGDGVYETTWATADYRAEPLNGVVDGQPGWPFWTLRAAGNRSFGRDRPAYGACAQPLVRVTARWGWAAVPASVYQACLVVASETHKLKDAPFGVAGFGEFGAVRVRANPIAMGWLAPYVREPTLMR